IIGTGRCPYMTVEKPMLDMKRRRIMLNLFNAVYFGFGAWAICAMVWKSWHYGFFFTPMPTLLTAFFVTYVAGATVSVFDLFKPLNCLGFPMSLVDRLR